MGFYKHFTIFFSLQDNYCIQSFYENIYMNQIQKPLVLIVFIVLFSGYSVLLNQWYFPQFSDFLNYYHEAKIYKYDRQLDPNFLFFQAPGHPVIMSLWMTLMNNDGEKYLQWINIFQYMLVIRIALFNYKILPLKFRLVGVIGLAICVSYVSLLGFLCAEFNFLLFFVIANHLLIRLIINQDTGKIKKSLLVFGIGLSLGIAQFVRPLSLYYFLFFVLSFLIVKYFFKENKYALPPNHYLLSVLVIFLLTTFSLYKITLNNWRFQPSQSGLWSVFVGLNVKSAGRYNAEDIQQFEKIGNHYLWRGENLRHILKEQIKSRLKQGLLYNLAHLPQRAAHLLVPYYTSYWFFEKGLSPNKTWIIFMKITFFISTIWCLLALGLNFWYFLRFFIKGFSSNVEIFIFCSLCSIYLYLIIHIIILEIQPRYAAYIMFMNLWISPFVFSKMIQKNTKNKKLNIF